MKLKKNCLPSQMSLKNCDNIVYKSLKDIMTCLKYKTQNTEVDETKNIKEDSTVYNSQMQCYNPIFDVPTVVCFAKKENLATITFNDNRLKKVSAINLIKSIVYQNFLHTFYSISRYFFQLHNILMIVRVIR